MFAESILKHLPLIPHGCFKGTPIFKGVQILGKFLIVSKGNPPFKYARQSFYMYPAAWSLHPTYQIKK